MTVEVKKVNMNLSCLWSYIGAGRFETECGFVTEGDHKEWKVCPFCGKRKELES